MLGPNSSVFDANLECKICGYITSVKKDFDKHNLTKKHRDRNARKCSVMLGPNPNLQCQCGKIYKHSQSLNRHKSSCGFAKDVKDKDEKEEEQQEQQEDVEDVKDKYKCLFTQLLQENAEFKNLLLEQGQKTIVLQQQIAEMIPKIGNITHNTTNITNNLNTFLNVDCKNAISIHEFAKNANIDMRNLMITTDKGYIVGFTTIFTEAMNKLSIHERPIQCSDTKRGILYVNNKAEGSLTPDWINDKEYELLKTMCRAMEQRQRALVEQWKADHPDFMESDKLKEEFARLIQRSHQSILDEHNEQKILNHIFKNTYIK